MTPSKRRYVRSPKGRATVRAQRIKLAMRGAHPCSRCGRVIAAPTSILCVACHNAIRNAMRHGDSEGRCMAALGVVDDDAW